MKRKYWFHAKQYGWGWYPSTWQGWTVICLYVCINLYLFYTIDSSSHSVSDTVMNYFPNAFFLIVALLVICYLTGEKPGWHWGKKKAKKR
jgi:hypothetical protein